MKVIVDDDKISVFSCKNVVCCDDDFSQYIKELTLKLKRNYCLDISGFYRVDVYINKKYGMIIDFSLEDDMYVFGDLVDLKVSVHDDCDMFLKYEDYFLYSCYDVYMYDDCYYININNVSKDDFYNGIEFCDIVYGENLHKVKNSLKKVLNS